MPLRKFEASVKVRDGHVTNTDRDTVVAEASRYLAYGDQSDVFGYNGAIEEVTVFEPIDSTGEQTVAITFQAMVPYGGEAMHKMTQQMDQLSRVQSFIEL
jgi:hypothetical protein